MEGLLLSEPLHAVSQLDFVARATLLFGENVEDFRLQNITAVQVIIRRRPGWFRLLDHFGHRKAVIDLLADTDDAVG
ncbi:hypothetical protein D3C80_1879900 [compost metagenome]